MPTPIEVRAARPEEYEALGELTARVYLQEGWAGEDYAGHLREVAERARTAQVLVALDGSRVVGAITVATEGGPVAEQAGPGEAVVRMLVADPAERGRGIGTALVGAALERARADGCRLVRLSTQAGMAAAHRLYARFGFVRTPENDWSPEPGLGLLAYAMALEPWCGLCGQDVLDADHTRCAAAREHEPPRWCPQCRRRMVVQVLPGGWTARCVQHGTTRQGSRAGQGSEAV